MYGPKGGSLMRAHKPALLASTLALCLTVGTAVYPTRWSWHGLTEMPVRQYRGLNR
jgi:hypothetical protein